MGWARVAEKVLKLERMVVRDWVKAAMCRTREAGLEGMGRSWKTVEGGTLSGKSYPRSDLNPCAIYSEM